VFEAPELKQRVQKIEMLKSLSSSIRQVFCSDNRSAMRIDMLLSKLSSSRDSQQGISTLPCLWISCLPRT